MRGEGEGARRAAAALVLLVAGCAGDGVERFDLGEAPDGIAALVTLDAAGAPVDVSPTFGLEAGALSFGARPQVSLPSGASRGVVVVVPRAALAARPEVVVEGLEGAVISPVEGAATLTRVATDDPLQARLRIPVVQVGAQVFGEGGATAALARLVIEVPALTEPCRVPERARLEPFTGQPRPLLQGGLQPSRWRGLAVLDPGRVLVAGTDVALLERGVPYDPTAPGTRVGALELFGAEVRFTGVGLDAPGADGRRRVLASAGTRAEGYLGELDLGPEGLAAVGTATTVATPLWSVGVGADGTVAAVGDNGLVLLGSRDAPVARRADLDNVSPPDDESRRLTFTGDPARPLAVASEGLVHVREAAADAWVPHVLTSDFGSNRFRGLTAQGEEVWAGGIRGAVFRGTTQGDFQILDLPLPPRMLPCATGESRGLDVEILRNVGVIAMDATHVAVTYEECTGILMVRRSDLCTWVVTPPSGEVGVEDGSYSAITLDEGRLVAVDELGGVWTNAPATP